MRLSISKLWFLNVFGLMTYLTFVKPFPQCPPGIVECRRYEPRWGICDVTCGRGNRVGSQLVRTKKTNSSLFRNRYCVEIVTEPCDESPCPGVDVVTQSGGSKITCNDNTPNCNGVDKEIPHCIYPDCPDRRCDAVPFISEIFPRQHTIDVEVMIPKGVDISPLFLYSYNAAYVGKPNPRDISRRGFIKSINGMDIYKVIVPCTFCGFNLKSGIALVDLEEKQNVIEFVSYGGSFSVTAGVVARKSASSTDTGIILKDLSVSIQRVGSGCRGEDFTWVTAKETLGTVNRQLEILY